MTFYALAGARKQLFTIDTRSGAVIRVLSDPYEDRSPNWSNDGRSLFFNSNRSGTGGCWKVGIADKVLTKVGHSLCWDNFESKNGRSLYFTATEPGLWRLDLTTGMETIVPTLATVRVERYITQTKDSFYFVDYEDPDNRIQRFDPSSGTKTIVGRLKGQPVQWEAGLSIALDEKSAIFTLEEEASSEIDALRQE